MLSRSRYSRDGHAWNSMSDMQLGSLLGGGVRMFGRGVRKKGVRTNPSNPPWLRAWGAVDREFINVTSNRCRHNVGPIRLNSV